MGQTELILATLIVAAAALLASVFAAWRAGRAPAALLDPRELQPLKDAAATTDRIIREEIARMRDEAEERGKHLRGEVRDHITGFGDSVRGGIGESRTAVDARLEAFAKAQSEAAEALRFEVGRTITAFGEGLKLDVGALTKAVNDRIGLFTEALKAQQSAFEQSTAQKLETMALRVAELARANGEAQEKLRAAVEEQLTKLRGENDAKLEQMRATVDEKLQGTLEKRLGESFKQVSERLETVHKGLGEMQTLATGVGDLKKVLSNVKERGGWAEMQLGALLDQMLAPEQFGANVRIDPASQQTVEFAIRLPGEGTGREIWLPIDAKFPKEDYERLTAAWENGDAEGAAAAREALERVIEAEAKKISEKYIRPPHSTDFAILYLPTEGLFAEAMRRDGLTARLQSKYRVSIAGPTTLAALLTALQMGFRTLTIQKRSSEVWQVLAEAKTEFEKYGVVWEKLAKQLSAAHNTAEEAGKRTRAVARKLRSVETLELTADAPLALAGPEDDEAP